MKRHRHQLGQSQVELSPRAPCFRKQLLGQAAASTRKQEPAQADAGHDGGAPASLPKMAGGKTGTVRFQQRRGHTRAAT
jgi:hypothetical protein